MLHTESCPAGIVLEVCQPWQLLVPGWYHADLSPIQSL